MTQKEEQKQTEEERELEQLVSQWSNMDTIEEQREDILDLISELELEATPIFICYALEKLIAILGNIIKSPQEDKFKTLKMDN